MFLDQGMILIKTYRMKWSVELLKLLNLTAVDWSVFLPYNQGPLDKLQQLLKMMMICWVQSCSLIDSLVTITQKEHFLMLYIAYKAQQYSIFNVQSCN